MRRGVAVVDLDAEAAAKALQQGVQFVVLILHQGFEREDIERVPVGVLQQRGDDRHVVDQGLPLAVGVATTTFSPSSALLMPSA